MNLNVNFAFDNTAKKSNSPNKVENLSSLLYIFKEKNAITYKHFYHSK